MDESSDELSSSCASGSGQFMEGNNWRAMSAGCGSRSFMRLSMGVISSGWGIGVISTLGGGGGSHVPKVHPLLGGSTAG